ncbi:MAG TPA: hypothetical protein VFZ25_10965, partial [Chloroflexota bacterium]|nr:hypothetical protein [Chloroflexota bacterium]
MERGLKWLLPALAVAEVALVRFRVISFGTAIGVVAGLEVLLLLVAVRQVFIAARRYRQGRVDGRDLWAALEDGLAVFLPRTLARIMTLEPRVWGYLALWLSRRWRPGPDDFSYRRRSLIGPLLIVIAFTTPVEVLLFEILIPWEWLRVVTLVTSVYSVGWVLGLYSSLVVLPHRLTADALRAHVGFLARVIVPYDRIAKVELERKKTSGFGDGLKVKPEDGAAYLAIGGQTDLTIELRDPRPIEGVFRSTIPVRIIYLAADDPARLAAELTRRASAGPRPDALMDSTRPHPL